MLRLQKREGLVLWMSKQCSSAARPNSFCVFLFLFLAAYFGTFSCSQLSSRTFLAKRSIPQCYQGEAVFTAAVWDGTDLQPRTLMMDVFYHPRSLNLEPDVLNDDDKNVRFLNEL